MNCGGPTTAETSTIDHDEREKSELEAYTVAELLVELRSQRIMYKEVRNKQPNVYTWI